MLTRIFFLQEITKVGDELGIVPVIIKGEQLNQNGFGGMKAICSQIFIFTYYTLQKAKKMMILPSDGQKVCLSLLIRIHEHE